jgi:hypothetical protein
MSCVGKETSNNPLTKKNNIGNKLGRGAFLPVCCHKIGNRKCKYARFFANITGKMQIIKDYQLY